MLADSASPWVQHIVDGTSVICRRCGSQLPAGAEAFTGEIYVADGRNFSQPPHFGNPPRLGKYDICPTTTAK